MLFVVLLTFAVASGAQSDPVASYLQARAAFLESEHEMSLGGTLPLSADEVAANSVLMQWKDLEYTDAHHGNATFAPQQHFFHSWPTRPGWQKMSGLPEFPVLYKAKKR